MAAQKSTRWVAVVTGANKGIGLECVRRLCQMPLPSDDATIILTARNADAGRAACAALVADSKATAEASWLGRWWGGTGPPLRREPAFHQLDIDDAASIEALAAHLRDEYGGVDCVINNAGMAYGMASDVAFPEQAERTVAVNYFGTRAMCRAMA